MFMECFKISFFLYLFNKKYIFIYYFSFENYLLNVFLFSCVFHLSFIKILHPEFDSKCEKMSVRIFVITELE